MPGADATSNLLDWHLQLLGLAGRVNDAVIARCRSLLAEHRLADLAEELVTGVLAHRVPLLGTEVDHLAFELEQTHGPDERLEEIAIAESSVPMTYGFAAVSRANHYPGTDEADRAAIETTGRQPGTTGLWRAWRTPTQNGTLPEVTRVYVIEADEDADLISVTDEVQRALASAAQTDPQVEVYPTGLELPSYQRIAQAHGELIWSRTPDPGVRIAVLFDEVDPASGPRFRPDHPTADDDERTKLVEYLARGKGLLLTTARLDDVVDPARGKVVPMNFRTDGTWVWSDATTYYLETYKLLPDSEMVEHIRGLDHIPPVVNAVSRHRAMAALQAPATEEPTWTFGP